MRRFEYTKPSTIEEAAQVLEKYGDRAKILNGGTDLIVRMRDNAIKPDYIVDIKGLPGMKQIGPAGDGGYLIGACITMNELVTNKDVLAYYPILAESAHEVGSFQLRNRATLIGNVCNASPSGDTLPVLYVLGADVKVYSKGRESLVPIEDFILGVRKIALNSGEIVMGVVLPRLTEKGFGSYYKHSRRKEVDLATVSAAILYNGGWKVCFGAVGPTPIRGRRTEEKLNGLKNISEESLVPVLETAVDEISPIDDVRASKEYRTEMVKVALKRAVMRVYNMLNGFGA